MSIANERMQAEAPKASPVAERPPSPWTPSYSVNHQGSSPLSSPAVKPKELETEVPVTAASEAPAETETAQQSEPAAEVCSCVFAEVIVLILSIRIWMLS